MSTPVPPPTATDYYLQIQALTPVNETSSSAAIQTSDLPIQLPFLTVVIFLTVLVIGAFALLITKSHQLNKMLVLLVLALTTSAIPMALQLVSAPASYQSQANVALTPRLVTVTAVTQYSFTISWTTDKPDIGSVRLVQLGAPAFSGLVVSEPTQVPSKQHALSPTNLVPGATYQVSILSGPQWYDNGGIPIIIHTLP